MITCNINPRSDGKFFIAVNYQSGGSEKFLNAVASNEQKAASMSVMLRREAISNTVVAYIKQRTVALREVGRIPDEIEASLRKLQYSINQLSNTRSPEIPKLVYQLRHDLLRIQPSEQSRFSAWRNVIADVIDTCQKLYTAHQ